MHCQAAALPVLAEAAGAAGRGQRARARRGLDDDEEPDQPVADQKAVLPRASGNPEGQRSGPWHADVVTSAETLSVVFSILAVGVSIGALIAAVSQAGSAREQAASAQKQADAAMEQLRLLHDQRKEEEEQARVEQARSVHLNHPERQWGEKSGDWNAASYPVNIHNRSKEDITQVEVSLYVDTGEDGGPGHQGFKVGRLLPDGVQGNMYKITAPRQFPYENWIAWTEAAFTDARSQRWLIDRNGQRLHIT
jgi:hypothetical protein